MVRVTIATTDKRTSILAPATKTVREILEENSVNYKGAALMIDGVMLTAATVGNTLAELDVTEACTISVTVKMDNAA